MTCNSLSCRGPGGFEGGVLKDKGKGKSRETTRVRLEPSTTLQSRKWQLIGMSTVNDTAAHYTYLLPTPANSWTRGAAGRHTTSTRYHRPNQLHEAFTS